MSAESEPANTSNSFQAVSDAFEILFALNTTVYAPYHHIYTKHADNLPSDAFGTFGEKTTRLIETFVDSGWKATEKRILKTYLSALETANRRLNGKQEESEPQTVALVCSQIRERRDWYRAQETVFSDNALRNAVEAVVTRNEEMEAVTEYAIDLLYHIDAEQAHEWSLAYLDRNRGQLDPDIVRDFIRVWRREEITTPAVMEWVIRWNGNKALIRQWPQLLTETDTYLQRVGLKHWLQTSSKRQNLTKHLQLLLQRKSLDTEALLRWTLQAVNRLGDHIDAFITYTAKLRSDENASKKPYLQSALQRELLGFEALSKPVLILADFLLSHPNGSNRLAKALLGISDKTVAQWHDELVETSRENLRKQFIAAMREDVSPENLIKRLSMGDDWLFMQLRCCLNLVTLQFDKYEDREYVTDILAEHIASKRFETLIAEQIKKRYRRVMQFLHEDSIKRFLPREQHDWLQQMETLPEITTLASLARRFLEARNSMDHTVEELIEFEYAFEDLVRQRRAAVIRNLMQRNQN
jgi:hypothetical protein